MELRQLAQAWGSGPKYSKACNISKNLQSYDFSRFLFSSLYCIWMPTINTGRLLRELSPLWVNPTRNSPVGSGMLLLKGKSILVAISHPEGSGEGTKSRSDITEQVLCSAPMVDQRWHITVSRSQGVHGKEREMGDWKTALVLAILLAEGVGLYSSSSHKKQVWRVRGLAPFPLSFSLGFLFSSSLSCC